MKTIIHDIQFEIRSIKTTRSVLRTFSIGLAVIFLLIASFLWYKELSQYLFFGIVGLVIGITGAILPNLYKYLFWFFSVIGIILGYFISRLLLTVIYILFFVPIGLFTRIFGIDLILKKIDKKAPTYWLKKESAIKTPERFEQLH